MIIAHKPAVARSPRQATPKEREITRFTGPYVVYQLTPVQNFLAALGCCGRKHAGGNVSTLATREYEISHKPAPWGTSD